MSQIIVFSAIVQSTVWRASALARGKVRSEASRVTEALLPETLPASFTVRVLDFDIFKAPSKLPSLRALNLATEGGIFGKPICTGSKKFVSDWSTAPPDFCRYENGQDSMTLFNPNEPYLGETPKQYDQYALERVMLGKWLELESERCGSDWRQHCSQADVVVVPSLGFRNLLMYGTTWTNVLKAIPTEQQAYWKIVRENLYQPLRNYTPIVIVHQPYTFVKDQSVDFLRILLEQPAGFVNRVVIGAIESNLRPEVRTRVHMPGDWQDNAESEIHRRAALKLKGAPSAAKGPVIVSLPYPTPILNPVSFLVDRGAYRKSTSRKVAIYLMASLNRGIGTNWIRPLVTETLKRYSGSNNGIVCSHTGTNTSSSDFCGVARTGVVHAQKKSDRPSPPLNFSAEKQPSKVPNMWQLLVDSAFCIEPAGDTLTRSHFYLAVLSGCIPVIIDGGHNLYSNSAKTAWAWRSWKPGNASAISGAFLDYSEFAVVYDAADFKARKDSIIQELVDMPTKEPQRFLALRQGLERVAPRMRYTGERYGKDFGDAFGTFTSVVMTQVRANK